MTENICPNCHADLIDWKINFRGENNPAVIAFSVIIGLQCIQQDCDYVKIVPDMVFNVIRTFIEQNEFERNLPIIWPIFLQAIEACIINKKHVPDDIQGVFIPIMREKLSTQYDLQYAQHGVKTNFRKDMNVISYFWPLGLNYHL